MFKVLLENPSAGGRIEPSDPTISDRPDRERILAMIDGSQKPCPVSRAQNPDQEFIPAVSCSGNVHFAFKDAKQARKGLALPDRLASFLDQFRSKGCKKLALHVAGQ